MSKTTEVICPHCNQAFTINESEYANLLNQISRHEIEQEVHEKLHLAEQNREQEIALACAKVRDELQSEISKKDLALAEAKANQQLAVSQAVSAIQNQCTELRMTLENKETEHKMLEATLKERYDAELRSKDDTIAYYKDLKTRMSTKMIGESLEQHCEALFNQLRATAFSQAYFEKDNEVSRASGSKGDYIYRDYDAAGNEIISIMFEMKNENETTATKHKNEDFLKELDKDRHEKQCEYAVLVSMLEADSELYNNGIVDVSHRYEKMYVIRPQFFIPIITILRNAAMNSLEYKAKLAEIREQNIDITDFETRIEDWKTSFSLNSDRATKNFNKAIKDIEDSIKKLEHTRDALVQTVKNFQIAEGKLDDLSIKRLTRGNPTMTAKFAELKSQQTEG